MAEHKLYETGRDREAIALTCSKCQANARFMFADAGVTDNGGAMTVSIELQDKWLGVDCPVADPAPVEPETK